MFLFFDIDTAGSPKKWNRPHTDTFNWPRMVRIAWLFYDNKKNLLESNDLIIKPEGFEIPYELEELHGISTDRAREEGVDLTEALTLFTDVVRRAEYIVAHNLNLKASVFGSECYRKNINQRLFETERYCTMQEGTYYCKLPGKYGKYKWPKLSELHKKLFGVGFAGSHDSKDGVQATARCFFKLIEIEAIDLF